MSRQHVCSVLIGNVSCCNQSIKGVEGRDILSLSSSLKLQVGKFIGLWKRGSLTIFPPSDINEYRQIKLTSLLPTPSNLPHLTRKCWKELMHTSSLQILQLVLRDRSLKCLAQISKRTSIHTSHRTLANKEAILNQLFFLPGLCIGVQEKPSISRSFPEILLPL